MKRSAALFAVFFACASAQPARTVAAAPEVAVPDDGSKLVFSGQAEGAQIYTCADGREWKLKAPDADVVGDVGRIRHYAGPTWEAADGSKVIGEVKGRAQVDPAAIPWLLLGAKSTEGAGILSHARWIQRLETRGGKAPAEGCDAAHAGAEVRVPYTAVYRIWGA